jgi:hypothetical protein
MSESDKKETTEVSCLCKKVTFQLTGAPMASAVCHCKECRKAFSTLASYNVLFGPNQVVLQTDEQYLKSFPITDKMTRYFCSECGTTMKVTAKGGVVVFNAAVLTGSDASKIPDAYQPGLQVWYTEKVMDLPGAEVNGKPKFKNLPTAFGGDGSLVE